MLTSMLAYIFLGLCCSNNVTSMVVTAITVPEAPIVLLPLKVRTV